MKLVLIEWVDSAQPTQAWRFLEDLPEKPLICHCQTVGHLLSETQEEYRVALSLATDRHDSSDWTQAAGITAIPKSCVMRVAFLQVSTFAGTMAEALVRRALSEGGAAAEASANVDRVLDKLEAERAASRTLFVPGLGVVRDNPGGGDHPREPRPRPGQHPVAGREMLKRMEDAGWSTGQQPRGYPPVRRG